jgi:hypothetical protein
VRISGIEQVDGKIRVVRLRPVEGEGEIKVCLDFSPRRRPFFGGWEGSRKFL